MIQSQVPRHAPFWLLVVPIALVASLVGLRALAEGVGVGNPAMPIATRDAGPSFARAASTAATAADAGAPRAVAITAPEVPKPKASLDGLDPDIDRMAPYPEALDLLSHAKRDATGKYVVNVNGVSTPLTLNPGLQRHVEKLLANYAPPYAAVVALEPSTGKILAMAQHSKADPGIHALGLRAVYPAASVFKLVTASALLEKGVDPTHPVCYHGGLHRIHKRNLEDSPRDHTCLDMGAALAHSANVVFAKLAHRHLSPEQLRAEAHKLGFNRALPFDQPVDHSVARIPDTSFEFATTAAGFGKVELSPLHGALLAAAVGNGGRMPRPTLLDDDAPPRSTRVLPARVAHTLAGMMARTVSEGTARRSFREHGRSVMRGIEVAGKTGSLDTRHPFHDFTWFVGFAPKDHPTVAVAVVVVNTLKWRVRAPYVARETLRHALFDDLPKSTLQARR